MPNPHPVARLLANAVLVLGLGWALSQGGAASEAIPERFLQLWQTADGLPENKIMAIAQSRDGYLWIGTYSGLARFDGVRFTLFDNGNTPQMRSPQVTSLFAAADGALWIGHANGEVTRYQKGRFEAVEIHPQWSGGKIHGIDSDAEGDIWLLNADGILARVRDGLVLTPEAGLVTNLVAMTRNAGGTIWVARNGCVSELSHGRLRRLLFGGESPMMYVQGIGASQDGGLWVMGDERIRKWSGEKWSEDFGVAPWNMSAIHNLIEMRRGSFAAGTSDQGLYLMAEDAEPAHYCRTNGFPIDWITSLCQDAEGNLWIGTGGGGLGVLRRGNLQSLAPPDRWQGRAVLSVRGARDGALWVGTEGAGLYRLYNDRWETFGEKDGLLNGYVWSLAEDELGRLWAGTWGGGLFLQRGQHFERAPGLQEFLSPVPALLAARQGGLWAGSVQGVMRIEGERSQWLKPASGRDMRDVCALAEAPDGTVWAGMSGGGLGRLKDGQWQFFRKADGLSSDFVQCLHLDANGSLWVGTFGGGLTRYQTGRFSAIGQLQGLANMVICDIQEDNLGYFWLSSHGGLLRIRKADLDQCAEGRLQSVECRTYGLNDGLPALQCSGGLQPAGCRTADGRLWFATIKGLATVDPAKVRLNPRPPPVAVEEFLVDDHPLDCFSETPLRIAPGRERLEFRYAGLSFVAPEKVRFKYRLNGWEKDWIEAGPRRSVNYSYIPPGDYSFEVTACNNDGVWSDTPATLRFTLLPHFWQTWWFHFAAGAGIVVLVSGLVWAETRRRMRRKLERLERQRAVEHERARIAKDIHDDLGASLTRITLLSQSARGGLDDPAQAASDLDRIYGTARELTRAMDEIVWAVNPKHDTLDSLANYLGKFGQDFLRAANIRCWLLMPVHLPLWPLSSELRHNLFLAFKEALNNIVKHSRATEVQVTLTLRPKAFTLMVQDNGCGFDPQALERPAVTALDRIESGHGLANMRRRLEEVSGRCEIQSAAASGTRVVFEVGVKPVP